MADLLVGTRSGAIEGDMEPAALGLDEPLGDRPGQERPVGVEPNLDAAAGGVLHHCEQVGREERLAQALQRELAETGKAVHEREELLEAERPLLLSDRRRVADQAHPAAQVARATDLHLELARKRRRRGVLRRGRVSGDTRSRWRETGAEKRLCFPRLSG